MVVRIHNVSKWACLAVGHGLSLNGQGVRKVRVEVNCPAPTRFDLLDASDTPVFLAVVQGMETLEFAVESEQAKLVPTSEDEVWYFTNDGDNHANEAVQPESFVKIMNRRTRNPQLELIEWKAKANERRRDAALEAERAEMRAYIASMRADGETGEIKDVAVGDGAGAGGAGGATAPAGGASEPAA